MTHIGKSYRSKVEASKADEETRFTCPKCNEVLTLSNQNKNEGATKVAHFKHRKQTQCTGVGSEKQRRTYILKELIKEKYPEAEVESSVNIESLEQEIDVIITWGEEEGIYQKGILAITVPSEEETTVEDQLISKAKSMGYSLLLIDPASIDADRWTGWLPAVIIHPPKDGFGLVHKIGKKNAPRSCAICTGEANIYLFKDDSISKFVCTRVCKYKRTRHLKYIIHLYASPISPD